MSNKGKIYYKKSHKWKKDKIFEAYGGYKCNCCGEILKPMLCIDHINNDGAKHRKELKKEKTIFYNWLIDNNYPDGFQVLCHNCNIGKYYNYKYNKKNWCYHQMSLFDEGNNLRQLMTGETAKQVASEN